MGSHHSTMDRQEIPDKEEYQRIQEQIARNRTKEFGADVVRLRKRIRTCIENGLDRCIIFDEKHGAAQMVLDEMNAKSYNARLERNEEDRASIVWGEVADKLPLYTESQPILKC